MAEDYRTTSDELVRYFGRDFISEEYKKEKASDLIAESAKDVKGKKLPEKKAEAEEKPAEETAKTEDKPAEKEAKAEKKPAAKKTTKKAAEGETAEKKPAAKKTAKKAEPKAE